MKTISLCYAAADLSIARRLADYLEVNLPFAVTCDEAVVTPELDILEAAERAIGAEVAIVLLSPASVPAPLDWKTCRSVLIEQPKELLTHVGFVMLAKCPFPPLLMRERFFDASSDFLGALRQIRQWLLRPNENGRRAMIVTPESEALRREVSDRPGIVRDVDARLAGLICEEWANDFEAVYALDCRHLSRPGILCEMTVALGLRPPGPIELIQEQLNEYCAGRRILLVLAGIGACDQAFIVPMGRASLVLMDPTAEALRGFTVNEASDAVREFLANPSLPNGWNAVKLLKEQFRSAEVMDVLGAMAQLARERGDSLSAARIEREQYWICDDVGYDGPAMDLRVATIAGWQLSFSF